MKKIFTMIMVVLLATTSLFALPPGAITTGIGPASCKVVYEQKPTIKAGFYNKNFTGYNDFLAGDSFAYGMGEELTYGTDFGGGSQNVIVMAVGTNYVTGYNITLTAGPLKNTAGGATDCLPYSIDINTNLISGTFEGTTGDSTLNFTGLGTPDSAKTIINAAALCAEDPNFGYLEVTFSNMKVKDSGVISDPVTVKKFATEFVVTITANT